MEFVSQAQLFSQYFWHVLCCWWDDEGILRFSAADNHTDIEHFAERITSSCTKNRSNRQKKIETTKHGTKNGTRNSIESCKFSKTYASENWMDLNRIFGCYRCEIDIEEILQFFLVECSMLIVPYLLSC